MCNNQKACKIEATREMIEAGAQAFWSYDPDFDNGESIALQIFKAMLAKASVETKDD